MSIALLDVNVMVALFDSEHAFHDAANHWFTRYPSGWATCPITLNGVVRVLSSPAYRAQLSIAEIVARLRAVTSRADHVFWPDSLSITSDSFEPTLIQGSKQITDIYLLGLAAFYGGRLVTFDESIPVKAVRGATKDHLLILRSP